MYMDPSSKAAKDGRVYASSRFAVAMLPIIAICKYNPDFKVGYIISLAACALLVLYCLIRYIAVWRNIDKFTTAARLNRLASNLLMLPYVTLLITLIAPDNDKIFGFITAAGFAAVALVRWKTGEAA